MKREIHDAFMQGPPGAIELFHGYTYSAHPIACAAGLATQKMYRDEACSSAHARWRPTGRDAVHSLKGRRNVVDLRAYGLVAGIELEPRPGQPRARAATMRSSPPSMPGILIRNTGDTIAMSPPFIIERAGSRPDLRDAWRQ